MEDFTKSYDSLAESAKEIFEASNYEKKYGGRILQKLAKRKGKLVTKLQWDKADKDQKADWLGKLPYSNSEEVARYIDVPWDALPSVIQNNMFESTEELDEESLNILIDEAVELELTEREMEDMFKKAGISLLKKGGKLALKVAKGTGRLAKKALKKSTIAMLKALLKKAEGIKTTPKEYDSFIQNMDQSGYMPAIDAIAQRDSLYKGAYSGSRNPFERGTLAFQMYNDLGEGVVTEAGKEILDEKLDKNMSIDESVRELIDTLSKKADTLKKAFKKSNKRIPNRLSKDMSVDEKAYWRVVDLIDTLSDTLKKKG